MVKKFLPFVFLSLLSCSDDFTDSFKDEPFYITATSSPHGKISPYGTIKMREIHPKFKFIPQKGYKMDSVFINGIYFKKFNNVVLKKNELTFFGVEEQLNTIQVTFVKK